jgi:hypothetical protein
MLLGLTPGHACNVISVVAEFMVDVAGVDALAIRDVSSGLAEFMVDVAGVDTWPCMCPDSMIRFSACTRSFYISAMH